MAILCTRLAALFFLCQPLAHQALAGLQVAMP